ncbi:MAG TPA: TIM barrel protein [Candidatus Alectryocaccobium stercorigallinarum]|nr:TIM barrel protein [Candidatus Alectryocaccobium stercorigallinarum]
MIKIGNCPDSWGVWFDSNDKQPDWHTYLDEVAEAGYVYTETGSYGYMSPDPVELKAELDKRGLKAVASTLSYDLSSDELTDENIISVKKTCDRLTAIGGEYLIFYDALYTDLITDEQIAPKELDEESFERFCKNWRRLAAAIRSYGCKPVFHPHGGTHCETEAQIDKMRSLIPKDELRFCFDTGHHIYVQGNDVYEYTKKIGDQIDFLHLKDLVPEIKEECWKNNIPYATATKKNVFAKIGYGQIDWRRYSEILKEIGFSGYAIIEHDCYPPVPGESFKIQKETGKYLESIGLGVLK